jgi:hypothetical protein
MIALKIPLHFCTGDVMPTPTYGVEHHIHTGSHPPVFAKSRRLDPEKLEIAKAEFKRLESPCNCCGLSGQANTPSPFGSLFNALATDGLAINLEKCMLQSPLWKFLATRFRR